MKSLLTTSEGVRLMTDPQRPDKPLDAIAENLASERENYGLDNYTALLTDALTDAYHQGFTAQAAQLETVRQERDEARRMVDERSTAYALYPAVAERLDRVTNERDELLARVASMEAGAARTGSIAEVQSGAVTAAERTEQGTICPVCKEPALQSWSRVDSDDCGVLCIACGAEFAPARNEEEPLAAAPR